jgi:hypothetical protein
MSEYSTWSNVYVKARTCEHVGLTPAPRDTTQGLPAGREAPPPRSHGRLDAATNAVGTRARPVHRHDVCHPRPWVVKLWLARGCSARVEHPPRPAPLRVHGPSQEVVSSRVARHPACGGCARRACGALRAGGYRRARSPMCALCHMQYSFLVTQGLGWYTSATLSIGKRPPMCTTQGLGHRCAQGLGQGVTECAGRACRPRYTRGEARGARAYARVGTESSGVHVGEPQRSPVPCAACSISSHVVQGLGRYTSGTSPLARHRRQGKSRRVLPKALGGTHR